ncbi:hypothetical protein BSNK01_27630 [Bacillaceae bacterium]
MQEAIASHLLLPPGYAKNENIAEYGRDSMRIFEGEQSNELSRKAANASLRYYEEAFGLDVRKLAEGDAGEWAKTQNFPPAFVLQLEELLCKANGQDQRYY